MFAYSGFQQNEHEDYEVVKVGNGEVSFQKTSSTATLCNLLQTVENKIEQHFEQLKQLTRRYCLLRTLNN